MQELISAFDKWSADDAALAVATVINTWGSSPRGVGSKMLVNKTGDMAGSVSGGCVEGAVVEASTEVIKTGNPRMLHFGVSDEKAWDVGLACGGEIDVFIRVVDQRLFKALKKRWEKGKSSILCVVIKGSPEFIGKEFLYLEDDSFSGMIASSQEDTFRLLVCEALKTRTSSATPILIGGSEEVEIFLDVIVPPPTLVIIGGVHIAISLVDFANRLGFKTVVIDPRRKFGSPERFPKANEVINSWPQSVFSRINLSSNTAVVLLSHDPKIDDPALEIALSTNVFYIGALGSKKTQSERRERLMALGFNQVQIDRVKGPIGIDINARSPEEIALAIMAQIIKEKNI